MADFFRFGSTVIDLVTVAIGFGLIIFVHELGHYLAARWAGIRVLSFAIGFGPALLSYKRGVGLRRGSIGESSRGPAAEAGGESAEAAGSAAGVATVGDVESTAGVGRPAARGPRREHHTEYRINALPLGGYVKMLGQEDLNPEAVSAAADSYQSCPPWKRMVVISAGVVMNLITAALLFILVFLVGLRTEPPVAGAIQPGSPAAAAEVVNASEVGLEGAEARGLREGDRILSIGPEGRGERPRSYNDVSLAVMMSERGTPLEVLVERDGFDVPLRLRATPEIDERIKLLRLGIGVPRSLTFETFEGSDQRDVDRELARIGLPRRVLGATVVSANGRPVGTPGELDAVFAASGGDPVVLTMEGPAEGGEGVTRFEVSVRPEAEMMLASLTPPRSDRGGAGAPVRLVEHVLGLVPVMRVGPLDERAAAQGLARGDVFAMLGDSEFPSGPEGIAEVRRRAGGVVDAVVLRGLGAEGEGAGDVERVDLSLRVDGSGTVGFTVDDSSMVDSIVAQPPARVWPVDAGGEAGREQGPGARPERPAAADLVRRAGTRIVSIDGVEIRTLIEARDVLIDAAAGRDGSDAVEVEVVLEEPIGSRASVTWRIPVAQAAALAELGWRNPIPPTLFETRQMLAKEAGPVAAIGRGLHETKRLMIQTYLTFARLFQGSVRVEHLKGPIGIAHVGTLIADRGVVWLMFFFAMISVNLAVINFLPLPIVDGGQFLMLVYEQVRGRPLPIVVQNAVTMAGLVLIGTVFLVVTFNDVRTLLGL